MTKQRSYNYSIALNNDLIRLEQLRATADYVRRSRLFLDDRKALISLINEAEMRRKRIKAAMEEIVDDGSSELGNPDFNILL